MFSFDSDSNQPIQVIIRRNVKLEPTSPNEHCLERIYSEYIYGPAATLCSGAVSFYEFNREERRSSVSGFRFTYSTQRNTQGGYFLFEIRGKSFMQSSCISVYKFTYKM